MDPFAEDLSNYWTAVLFFKAQNGTYKRVPIRGNVGFEGANGGMTIYYMQDGLADFEQKSRVTAFRPGFRMLVGDQGARTPDKAEPYRQLTYTCLQDLYTRYPETKDFPSQPCPAGIMVNPFVWSMDDETGYGNHGDYVFGWKDDSLQRTMDSPCYVNCDTLTTQSMSAQNECTIKSAVDEDVDGCKFKFYVDMLYLSI
ncbi:hypothetical protein SLS63_005690 [Diaporthe eres]|uniref:DUF1996 domain-containing protein n=1 Tax=Diaporthe eres TaxID=83184 RepID=A0ABR1PAA0_DIAER